MHNLVNDYWSRQVNDEGCRNRQRMHHNQIYLGVMTTGSLFFIGDKVGEREWQITRKPDFYDAVLLSFQPPQVTAKFHYESISLNSAGIIFNLHEHNIYFTYQHQKIEIETGQKELSEEEVFDAFRNLLIKEGKRVSYLVQMPKRKMSQVKKKQAGVLAEAKKLTIKVTK
jgi:hypothetical protein